MTAVRTIVVKARLTEEENVVLHKKAESYHGNVSALLRDAILQVNDIRTRRKIEVMTKLMTFYQLFEQRLGWLGGNFNQTMKRANELAVAGKLEKVYFEEEIVPRLDEMKPVLQEMKDYLTKLSEKTA